MLFITFGIGICFGGQFMWGFGMVSKVISNLCEISTGSFCTAKHAVAFIHSACHVILQRLARIKYNPQGHKSLNKSNLCKFRSFFVHNSYQCCEGLWPRWQTKSNEQVQNMNGHLNFVVHKLICLCTVLMKFMEILVSQCASQGRSVQPSHLTWHALV